MHAAPGQMHLILQVSMLYVTPYGVFGKLALIFIILSARRAYLSAHFSNPPRRM